LIEQATPEKITRIALTLYDWARLLGNTVRFDDWSRQFSRGDNAYKAWARIKRDFKYLGIKYKNIPGEGRWLDVQFPSRKYMFQVVDELIGPPEYHESKDGSAPSPKQVAELTGIIYDQAYM